MLQEVQQSEGAGLLPCLVTLKSYSGFLHTICSQPTCPPYLPTHTHTREALLTEPHCPTSSTVGHSSSLSTRAISLLEASDEPSPWTHCRAAPSEQGPLSNVLLLYSLKTASPLSHPFTAPPTQKKLQASDPKSHNDLIIQTYHYFGKETEKKKQAPKRVQAL